MLKTKLFLICLLLLICILLPNRFPNFSSNTHFSNVENSLFIPKIDLKVPIIESFSFSTLEDFAVVNFYPNIQGNVVVYGHRYTNKRPLSSIFFSLDVLSIGDSILMKWKGKEYKYEVTSKEIVYPKELWILSQKKVPTLTLITCTPLYNPVQRLVIFSTLVSID